MKDDKNSSLKGMDAYYARKKLMFEELRKQGFFDEVINPHYKKSGIKITLKAAKSKQEKKELNKSYRKEYYKTIQKKRDQE